MTNYDGVEKMSYFDVVEEIKKKKFYPIYLLFGSESYLIQDLEQKLIKSIIDEPEHGLNFSTLDLEETPIQEAILDAETFPFFGEKKILLLKNASIFKANPDKTKVEHNLKVLEDYLVDPVDHTVVIFVAPYEKVDERKKIVKRMKETGKVVKCDPPKEWEVQKWINMLASQLGVHIDEQGSNVLLEEVGTDLMAISKEIEKFASYVGENKQITKEVVENLVSRHVESSAFKMVDAVMNKNLGEAIGIFKELTKRKEEPIALLALFASQLRLILQCKLLKNKGYTSQQMSKQVKAHRYAVKMALEREKHFSLNQLYEMITVLAKTDEQMKRGEVEKELAFELLLHNLTTVAKVK